MFTPSVAPDITEGLPGPLASVILTDYPAEAGWDITLGQLGFTLRPNASHPYVRASEQQKKTQIDTSVPAGEQSLSSWWIRGQDSWDMGAGLTWYEPGARSYDGTRDRETLRRFHDSFGIDPWTQGEAKLLHSAVVSTPVRAAPSYLSNLPVGGNAGYVESYGSTATWTPLGGAGTAATVTLPGASATQPAAAGGAAYIGHVNGISKFTPGSAIATPITCTGTARVWWVKARLMVAVGPVLYEVPANATGVLGATGVGTAVYTHPDASWLWSDVSETSGAILAAGYSGGDSAIFRLTLEQDTLGQPILSGASQVGRTPPGERITCMAVYLGATLVLGTSSGVRIGIVSDTGDIQYGPLTIETAAPVWDVTFADRYAYVTVTAAQAGGLSGAARIDLSAEIVSTGRYAYAFDMPASTGGLCRSIAVVGTRVILSVGDAISVQSATAYVAQGWIDTGRIRFGTVEPKIFRYLRVIAATSGGTVGVVAVTADAIEHRIVDFDDSYNTQDDTAIAVPNRPTNQYLSFRVYLTPGTATPVLSALSVKAAPATSKVRMIQLPLSCYDFEEDRQGNRYGAEGGSYVRLAALEAMEDRGQPVIVTDHRTGEAFVGQVDSVEFSALNPPSKSLANYGGLVQVVVRRL
jgi:hypothetical protein